MFFHRITLFRLLGFTVRVDLSWLLLGVLIAWSLAAGYFPAEAPGLAKATYWWMGIAGALGLAFSIVFHEFSHSIVAGYYRMPITGITLFVFGGVAEMEDEPTGPTGEFLMAIAGPIASLVLAGAFHGIAAAGIALGWPAGVTAVLAWLAFINLLLALFNLVPAFPLDGGRMLRAALWGWKRDLRWATRIAANAGALFGMLLIALGLVNVIGGNFIAGMWYFLIGMFVRGAASGAFLRTMTRQALGGRKVRELMQARPVTVPAGTSLQHLVDDYMYRYHFRTFPVLQDGRPVGCVTLEQVRQVAREAWPRIAVEEVMEALSAHNTVDPDDDVLEALKRMQKGGISKLMVVEGGHLAGILTLRDLMGFLSIRLALEQGEQLDPEDSGRLGLPGARG